MSVKINPSSRNPKKRPPLKPKSNKKKLFFIFSGAFIAFFLFCTFLASILTPKIDVPALKNDPNLDSLTSEDFKGRIDPRLKSIELQEDAPPATETVNPFQKNDGESSAFQDEIVIDSKVSDSNIDESQIDSEFNEFDQVPFNNNRNSGAKDQSQIQKPASLQPGQVKRPQPSPIAPPEQKSNDALILRDKIKVNREPISMNKVIVGNYASPIEAKRVSEELMKTNLNVTPFIKENGGVYSLQVGSFSSSQKAEVLVNELKKRNVPAKIIQN